MLEIVGYVLLGLVVLIGIILAIASTRPDSFHVSRTRRINAPADRLFGQINDLRLMNTWNPYALRETTGTTSYSGPDSGKGAKFHFDGKKSGSGSIEIIDAAAPRNVTMRLLMHKPFKADNTIVFTIAPQAEGNDVTWAMSGKQPLLAKVMTMFLDCDKMVGRDFEEGFSNLKAKVETV
jgi:uncharacterized protein YndB with AHSA1/START domain